MPSPLALRQQSSQFEHLQRLAERHSIHAELLAQLPFGRQPIACREFACLDLADQTFGDLDVAWNTGTLRLIETSLLPLAVSPYNWYIPICDCRQVDSWPVGLCPP